MGRSLSMHALPGLADAWLVLAFEGWNDAGEAATRAARYVQDAVATAPLARIDGEEYFDFTVRRPTVRIDEGAVRRIAWPGWAFRYGALAGHGELVVGLGPEPHLRWRSFCDEVVELVLRVGLRRVVLLGGFLADVLYSRPVRVSGFASSAERMERLDVDPSAYEGPTGIVGVLGDRLRAEGVEVVSLWVGLPHYIAVSPNARGALALVQRVCELLDLPVDRAPLEAEAAAFDEQVSELVSSDPALAEYVKELKRREFAQ
jgi:hypothetical protein